MVVREYVTVFRHNITRTHGLKIPLGRIVALEKIPKHLRNLLIGHVPGLRPAGTATDGNFDDGGGVILNQIREVTQRLSLSWEGDEQQAAAQHQGGARPTGFTPALY